MINSLFIRQIFCRFRLKGLVVKKYLFCFFVGSIVSRVCEVFLFSIFIFEDDFVEGNVCFLSFFSFCIFVYFVELDCFLFYILFYFFFDIWSVVID